MKKTLLRALILIVAIIAIWGFVKKVAYDKSSRTPANSTNAFSTVESKKYQQKTGTPAVVSKEKPKKATTSVDRQEKNSLQIEINGQAIHLLFEGKGIDRKTKKIITDDIDLVLSHAGPVEWVPKSSPKKLRGLTITHKLQGLGKDRKNLPEAIAECIEAGIEIDGVLHLLVPRQLISVYKQALEQKENHPQMYVQLDDFINLLENKEQLHKMLENKDEARSMVYCYQTTPSWGLHILETCANSGMDIEPPSLLSVKPLGVIFDDKSLDECVFGMWTTVTWEKTGNKEVIPLGAYTDKWRVLSYPIP